VDKHRICILSHLFPRNEQDYKGGLVRDLALELTQRGHEVHVVTPMRPGATREEITAGIRVHRFPYYGWRSGIQLGELKGTPALLLGSLMVLGTIKCLTSVLKHNVDLVHACWVVPGGLMGLIVGRLTGRPVVATAAGSDLNIAPQNRFVRLLTTLTLKHIDKLLPLSTALKQTAIVLGLPEHKANVTYGTVGIDIPVLDKVPRKSPVNRRESRIILYVGNLTPPRRADTVIQAMHRVVEIAKDCQLFLVGEGNLRSSLESLTDELDLSSHVHFCGPLPRDQVLAMLPNADVFVHCSNHEGLGIAIMEAMGAGLPVVASRVGGVPDLVHEGKTGFMLSPDDVEGYADRIISLLKNDQLRKQLGANGRSFAEKYLNKDAILSQTEKVYQDALHERKDI
jgi:glycosyltransferase involved in cell wall biosynthesis